MQTHPQSETEISFEDFKAQVLNDYRIAVTSRECSLLGRREVLTGKAKFGIFGDGKEVTNVFDNFVGTFQNNSTTNPSGSTTVSIRIQFQLNSGDEDIAIDNFYLLEEDN